MSSVLLNINFKNIVAFFNYHFIQNPWQTKNYLSTVTVPLREIFNPVYPDALTK